MAETNTTAPPKQPTSGDIATLGFALGLERSMADLYALAAPKVGKDNQAVFSAFGEHHKAYVQSLAGLLGRNAPTARNAAFYDAFAEAAAAGSAAEIAATFQALENGFVATHLAVLGTLRGTNGAELIASIIAIEARHATVLGALAGKTGLGDLLDNPAEALSAETYPA